MDIGEHHEDRDAIYYPFTHVRDEAWLRSTLLFFPHVLRMAPAHYQLNDSKFVGELARTNGRRGEPLVGRYPLDSFEAHQAGTRLALRFAADIPDPAFRAKYSRAATQAAHGNDSLFQIHRDKFAEPPLDLLVGAGLVWPPNQETRPDPGEHWLAVHPVIGEVIMSTAAADAATRKGCDVLTHEEGAHLVTSTRDEDVIYATLLERPGTDGARKPHALGIGNVVVATTFDLSKLKPADFAVLSKERGALFDLRKLLAERAAQIPAMSDADTRMKHVCDAAGEIVAEWEKKRMGWGNYLKRLFRVEAAEPAKEAATGLLGLAFGAGGGGAAAGAGAAAGTVALAAAPGLAVGFALYGVQTWRTQAAEAEAAPTRFLSRIAKHGGVLAAAGPPSSAD